jgi:hypothetical protein
MCGSGHGWWWPEHPGPPAGRSGNVGRRHRAHVAAEHQESEDEASNGEAILDVALGGAPRDGDGKRCGEGDAPVDEEKERIETLDELHAPSEGAALRRARRESVAQLLRA